MEKYRDDSRQAGRLSFYRVWLHKQSAEGGAHILHKTPAGFWIHDRGEDQPGQCPFLGRPAFVQREHRGGRLVITDERQRQRDQALQRGKGQENAEVAFLKHLGF